MTGLGVCELGIIPVRISDTETSEMINQLLFGDLVKIHEENGSWLFIESVHDNYQGWIDKQMISLINESEFTRLQSSDLKHINKITSTVLRNNTDKVNIFFGSSIRGLENESFIIGNNTYHVNSEDIYIQETDSASSLLSLAKEFLFSPYLWGGRSPGGIDCSGFVQVLFSIIGISLYRDSGQQANQGKAVDFIEEASPGDLVFFDNDEGRIIHVGLLINNKLVIHASGHVRIDTIDHHGIYRQEEKKYSHKLRLIKRLLD